MDREILNPQPDPPEAQQESVPPPRTLREFVGQRELKGQLEVFLEAARGRGDCLDHVILHGHPGLGKTTLANILSAEMGAGLRCTSGPVIVRPGDLAGLLTNLAPGDVLFIDEIHRLPPVVEEILYPAMEEFRLDVMVGQGPGSRAVRLELPRFTLVGATTRVGLLSAPLRDRFGIQLRLEYYGAEDLKSIVERAASLMNAPLTGDGAMEIAKRSRGTPRIAGRLLRRVRDYAQVKGEGLIDRPTADMALRLLGIDSQGLDQLDYRILDCLCRSYRGGPVGLEALAVTLGEEAETLLTVYEPYLVQEGFMVRTRRGRAATPKAWRHVGLDPPEEQEAGLPPKALF
ncbi:MAG: Holliday junction branch migration DNA helicase RuvB [Deltaproteobacteria bacterium]|jgi:Holliday junction DNA helicase RuvB|nr:Holliday junction branch migration DNA helicase RuvB [Deltaproteobacteria bacterium]